MAEYKQLYDQFNNPIPREEIASLKEEISAPSSMSARPPFVGHIGFDITPQQLGQIIRGADSGQTREWFILAEEIEELFAHYSAVLSKRRRQVSLLPMTVIAAENAPDGERHAEFVREWLASEVLEDAMFDITDGIGKGYVPCEIMWDSQPDGMRPKEIAWRNQRDFEVSWRDGQTIWLRSENGYDELARHKFLLHRHPFKSGNPVRNGLTRAVAWLWMYSTYTLKDWALFVQGYGLPTRLGKYGPESSYQDRRVLMRAVRDIAGSLAAIIPKSMDMELVEAKGANDGSRLFDGRATWLNMEVSKLVLGGVAGTDAVKGSHAVGEEHRKAEDDVEKFDARLIAKSINRQIIQPMIAFSFGQQKGYPRIRIGEDEQVSLAAMIAGVADLVPVGLKVKAQEVRDRLQLTKPEAGDEVLEAPAPVAGPDGAPAVKPNPHPLINPNSDSHALMTGALFGRLVASHSAQMGDDEVKATLAALDARVAREAAGALGGMSAEIHAEFLAAHDMTDLAHRLTKLKLDDEQFAEAMARGMALANLAGQAALMDELRPLGRQG
jgi:phage gp29-like protein